MVVEKTCENPLDSKMIKPVNPKGNEPWIFIGRMDADAEKPTHWKRLMLGKTEGRKRRG